MHIKSSTTTHYDSPILGITYAAGAFFLLAVMNMFAKILANHHHIIEIAFYRNLFCVIPFLIYILATQNYNLFETKTPKALTARSVLGTISLITTFAAFSHLPMAEVTVLLFTTALIIPALAFFILKEPVGLYRWGAILTGFLGVFIMVGTSGITGQWFGIALALSAACMHATLGLLLRFMKEESPITVTFYFVLTGTILTGIFMPFIATTPTVENMLLMICTGASGGFAQLFLALAFKNAPASVIAPFNYTGLIWATSFDILIWNFIPGWPVFWGAAIIMAANLFILYREQHKKRHKNNYHE